MITDFYSKIGAEPEKNCNEYSDFAEEYDATHDVGGFNDPFQVANAIIDQKLPLDSKILDICCGTGKVGEFLHKSGFTTIDGVDGSTNMLKVCNQKGIYRETWECLIGVKDYPVTEKRYNVIS